MALVTPAKTPSIALSRALKRAGLEAGKGNDFQVKGRYRNGERLFTFIRTRSDRAAAVIAERADDIERWTDQDGYPFKVSIRYMGRTLLVDVMNGAGERVRETAPVVGETVAAEEPAENAPAAEEPAAPAVVPVTVTGSKARHYAHTGGFLTRTIGCGQSVRARLTDERAAKYPYECRACTAAVAALVPAAAVEAPAVEETAADAFRAGDIVAIDGRPGDWELMEPAAAPHSWVVEPARPNHREPEEVPASALHALEDAPHVRRGDLVMQNYAEQTRAAEVGAVFRCGRWVATKRYPQADGTWTLSTDDVETLVVVTREQVESAHQEHVEHGDHQGRIIQAVVTRHAGEFRVVCSCTQGMEVYRGGRRVGWSSSLEAARALWQWHAAGEVGPAPADFTETAPAAEEPAVSYAESHRQEQQAKALGWSTRHAELVRWAAAGELRMETPDDLRRVTTPGRLGRRVAIALLRPLAAAAFVTLGEPDEEGRHRVEATADGRRALLVWDRTGPTPAVISRKQEGQELRPLQGGQEHRRRSAEFEADLKRRAAEREAWYAAHDLRMAAEEREAPLRAVWAEAEGVWNPFSRRPAGWAPTPDQVEEFRIRPELVAELEEEAARLAAEAAPEPEETSSAPAAVHEVPEAPAAYVGHDAAPTNLSMLTLQSECVSIEVSGRAQGPTGKGHHEQRHRHHPQRLHRHCGRRPHLRGRHCPPRPHDLHAGRRLEVGGRRGGGRGPGGRIRGPRPRGGTPRGRPAPGPHGLPAAHRVVRPDRG